MQMLPEDGDLLQVLANIYKAVDGTSDGHFYGTFQEPLEPLFGYVSSRFTNFSYREWLS